LHLRQFESTIDPAAASPTRGADIPVRMIVEGHEHERLGKPANPEAAQVMEIAGAINKKRREPRIELAKKFLDQPRGRGETQTRPPFPRIQHRQVAREIGPGIVEIKVQSLKSLCAQYAGRKRS